MNCIKIEIGPAVYKILKIIQLLMPIESCTNHKIWRELEYTSLEYYLIFKTKRNTNGKWRIIRRYREGNLW